GNYYVEVFNALGCSSVSAVLTINNVGISENSNTSSLSVYPNPTTNKFTVDFMLSKASPVKINVMNISGQIVYTEEIEALPGNNKKEISLSKNASGIYYLQLITNNEVINKKIIKN
ncbi:MAG: T9SS type A sorting domain-containing protein, partial [Bacteroidetes bacterium]|nr:T9SS type A sorting domain-containing protein [Bacteroidota bacterium]